MKKKIINVLGTMIGLVLFANVACAADVTPPTVNVNNPSSNAIVKGSVLTECKASDDVKVTRGEIYIDSVLKNPDTFSNFGTYVFFDYTWDTSSGTAGNHTIYCKAYDAAGNVGTSVVRTVIVDKTPDTVPPVITSVDPANGAKISGFEVFGPFASDDSGLIVKDELYFDGQLKYANNALTKDQQGYMYFKVNTYKIANGPHNFFIKVYDSAGNVATSPTNTITVYNAPPLVNVTSPASGSTASRIVHVAAQASSPSSLSSIEIYYDGISICSKKYAPINKLPSASLTCDWDTGTVYNKVHQITAQASDETGVKTLSPAVSITINNIAGEFRFTNPVNGATVSGMVPVSTFASHADMTEFYLDGMSIRGWQSCATCNFSWNSTTVGNGAHALKARAIWDGAYHETTETVNVSNNSNTDITAPTVSITNPPVMSSSYTVAQTVVVKANASDNVGVAKVEFYIDDVLKGTDTTSPYEYNWTITAADSGDRGLMVKVYDAAGNSASVGKGVTVDIVTSDTIAPEVYLSAPAVDTIYTAAQTVTINATAYDRFGVTKVVFYDGSTILGTGTPSSYSKYSWAITAANNGNHVLTAKAYDAAGNVGSSGSVSVTVSIASGSDTINPAVSITAPTSGTSYTGAQTVTVSASASDNVGVERVEFYDGSTLLGTDTTSPYSYPWVITGANNGSHSLTAKAYDAAGNVGTSAVIAATVNIAAADTAAPAVSLTSPTANANYTTAQTVTLAASASDNVGVTRVEFYDGSALLGTDTTSPYSYSWAITSTNSGSHSLTAKAYDAVGNSKVSAAVNITVSIVTGCTSNASCDDGIYCNGAETCQSGKCVKGAAVTCNDSNACTSDTCSETAKACAYAPLTDNTSCASGVCCAGTCKAGAATCSGTGTVCWNGSYQNLYAGTIQMKKFCYCAQGTYSYKSYQMNSGSRVAAYYTSPYYTTDWSAKSLTATLSISSVTCSDGKAYLTNQTYAYPAVSNAVLNIAPGDTTNPTVLITAPRNNISLIGSLDINVNAYDAVGISKVEIYADNVLKGTDTSAPYSFEWDTPWELSDGTHILTAKAYNTAGKSAISSAITLTVKNGVDVTPPAVSITAPANNSTVKGSIDVFASAQDTAALPKVDLYLDNVLMASNTIMFKWNSVSVANGIHIWTAKAYDAAGNTTTSAPVSVKVSN
jgi:hypothetical protein